MISTLEYSVAGRPAVSDATVLGDYSVPTVGSVEDLSIEIARDDPPRAKVRLAPRYQHLAPAVKEAIGLMGEAPGCASWLAVAAVMNYLAVHGSALSAPAVSPTEGGIQVEWFQSDVGVELEFDAEGNGIVLLDVDGNVEARAVSGPTDSWLIDALRFVRRG